MTHTPHPEKHPIFIGGENRSGTTLTGILLDTHPDIVMGSELDFVSPSFEHIRNQEHGPAEQRLLRQLGRFGITENVVHGLTELAADELGATPTSYHERCQMMRLFGEYKASNEDVAYWGFQIQRRIADADLIRLTLPDARFIHVIRDGRDVAASHLKLKDIAWTYKDVREAAIGWSSLIQRMESVDAEVVNVRYEAIVRDQRQTVEALLGRLGLTWDEAIMRHEKNQHDLFLAPAEHPSTSQVKQPVYATSVGTYLNILSDKEIALFEEIAGEQLGQLGYI